MEPLGFQRWGFSPHVTLLIPTFALDTAPQWLPLLLLRRYRRSPTTCPSLVGHIPRFGTRFSPGTLSAQRSSTSELLRTLSRVAASKPTSWLSGARHFLSSLNLDLGTLAVGLGCYPFDDECSHPPSHSVTIGYRYSQFAASW